MVETGLMVEMELMDSQEQKVSQEFPDKVEHLALMVNLVQGVKTVEMDIMVPLVKQERGVNLVHQVKEVTLASQELMDYQD